jgi:hypothetical protein
MDNGKAICFLKITNLDAEADIVCSHASAKKKGLAVASPLKGLPSLGEGDRDQRAISAA